MKYLILLLAVCLSACSAIEQKFTLYSDDKEDNTPREVYLPQSQEGSLHKYVEQLARQLFDTAPDLDTSGAILVGTFLPAASLQSEDNSKLQGFGLQLQESFATLSTQAGLKVIEYKALSGVMVADNADLMLSREVAQLDNKISAQYLLTGNYIQQENSLVVNVKLINVEDKSLVAAATDYLPLNAMYSHNKVRLQDGMLYRGQY